MVQELDVSEIVELCSPAESVVLHPGEFLFQEGDEAHALYVVKKGVLRVVSGSTVYETVRAGASSARRRRRIPVAGRDQAELRADRHAGHGAPIEDHGPALRAELARGAGLTLRYAASDFSFGLI